jgi:hypothetical protein
VRKSQDSPKSPRPKSARARKPAEPKQPREPERPELADDSNLPPRKYSPDAEMADILDQAVRRQYYLVTPEEMDELRIQEIRQLHIARLQHQWLQQQRHPGNRGKAQGPPGAPPKLTKVAEAEIRRRIANDEIGIASAMAKNFPGVMTPRSWHNHVARLRLKVKKMK